MWSYVAPWKRGEIEAPDFIRTAAQLGVDGVELLDFFYRDKQDWSTETDQIRAALDETGLPVGVFSVGNDFAQADPSARASQVDVIKRGVDQANVFGAGVVRVFAGGDLPGTPNETVFDWFLEGLCEASYYANDKGVKLALENHGLIAGRSDQINDLVHKVRIATGNSVLGANPDTGNFLLVNEDSTDAVRGVAKYAHMCHFKDFELAPPNWTGHAYTALDGTRFIGSAIGEGGVDLAACIDALREIGFDGWVNIEYESEEDPTSGVPRSVMNARRVVN
ncbi:MAG: sugar phosphate isomerase/epimerase [Armatimonadota bacterium]|nr:sugar phosphate isomerase/epimerase [Armatimonadota bacterium]